MEKLQKLKSLIKLNKLFHYEFKIPKDLFYELKLKTYFITLDNDYIRCYGNKKLFNELLKYDVEYINQYKIFFRSVFFKRIIMIISFISISMVFFSSSYFIREIRFINNSYYDVRVYNYVLSKLDKRLFMYTLTEDLNEISRTLRASFPNYAYIGISKKGSVLEIDIEKIDIKKNNDYILNKQPIVSNYNAVIYSISCKEGVVLINLNQSVKQGEVLVTPNSDTGYTDAVILGKLSEYKKVVVKKEVLDYGLTGEMCVKYGIKVGKNYLMKFKDLYEEQEIKIVKMFSLFNLIEFSKVYYYEKDFYKQIYTYEDAYNYAISSFYRDLELYRKSNLEKINEIKLINYEETDEEFVFYFLVNRIKSIGIYSYNN